MLIAAAAAAEAYQQRDAAEVAKIEEKIAESKARGEKRGYASITARKNAYREALQSGKKYVPPGRLGSEKHKKSRSKKALKLPEKGEGEVGFFVEKLLGTRMNGEMREFRVQWHGYPDPVDHTWEPAGNLVGLCVYLCV